MCRHDACDMRFKVCYYYMQEYFILLERETMMKTQSRIIAAALSFLMMFPTTAVYAEGEGSWRSNSRGWWYENADGTFPQNELKEIEGKTYYFDGSGYMATGWLQIGGDYYFFEKSGAMKTSAWEGDYYLLEDGKMAKDQWVDNNKYYVDKSGKWHQAHWESNSKGWWYVNEDTTYPVSEFKTINGKTYYFDGSGYMATGWVKAENEYYFFDKSGVMKTSAWEGDYYLKEDGRMAVSEWIGEYYVGADGKWIPAHWVKKNNRWTYDFGDGTYPTGFYTINGKEYYFDDAGYMADGWIEIGSDYYFFDSSGTMKKSAWEGNYYLKEDGRMAVSEWIGGKYTGEYVGPDGAWIPGEWIPQGNSWKYRYGNGDSPAPGFVTIKNATYYFQDSGLIALGWQTINGKEYYFGTGGAMSVGWAKLYDDYYDCDHWFYFESDGSLVNGWKKIGGYYYYFSKFNGYMYYYGWYEIDGKSYWFKPSGQMITGWYHYNGEAMMDGAEGFEGWVYCDSNGQGHNGWISYGSDWYYAEDGDIYIGMYYIDGVFYAFDLNGKMYKDRFVYPFTFDMYYFDSSYPYHVDADGKGSYGWYRYDSITEYYYVNGEARIKRTSW